MSNEDDGMLKGMLRYLITLNQVQIRHNRQQKSLTHVADGVGRVKRVEGGRCGFVVGQRPKRPCI